MFINQTFLLNNNKQNYNISTIFITFPVGGLPPFLGFVQKLITIQSIINNSSILIISTTVILSLIITVIILHNRTFPIPEVGEYIIRFLRSEMRFYSHTWVTGKLQCPLPLFDSYAVTIQLFRRLQFRIWNCSSFPEDCFPLFVKCLF